MPPLVIIRPPGSGARPWTDSIRRLLDDGFDTFVEVGPGKVLSGLMRQIDPAATTYPTGDATGVEKAVAALRSA